MIYITKNGNIYEKYNVEIDIERLKGLKIEIINNCSEIVHQSYDSYVKPKHCFDYYRIRDYKEKKVGYKEFDEGPDQPIYHFDYLEYKYPSIIKVIDKVLDGDGSELDKLLNPENIEERTTINQKIIEKKEEIDKIDSSSVKEKIEGLEELKELFEQLDLNKNQISVKHYCKQLSDCFELTIIAVVSEEKVLQVVDFFETEDNIKQFALKLK